MVYSASQYSEKLGNSKNGKLMRSIIRVVKILEKFTGNYEKRLNFSKLSHLLHLTSSEADEIITLIMSFQELFSNIFNKHIIKKEIKDNQIFIITEPKKTLHYIPNKIKLSPEDCNLLSDIIYMFKFVKRGNGFDVKANGTELLSNIKELWNFHPYLFEEHENGLYPSKFGVKLGELILSYKKSGKSIEIIDLDNHTIMVDIHERK
ncbi:MAG: hypothetical protein ACW98D_11260 [Promethearchaeota archaeon]|jgi:hypothetical protein